MIERSICNPDLLAVVDGDAQNTYYGCNQAWYATDWQRRAGCGPSVACNLFHYLIRSASNITSKETWLSLMEETWEYVTPTVKGMPTTKLFYESVLSYARAKGLEVEYKHLDIPEDKPCRPSFREIAGFIGEGLLKDAPVAFLNLCNGEEKNLYRWHWVTIISLDYAEDGSHAMVNILDEGLIKKIDLALWYETTMLGGGFVYFTKMQSGGCCGGNAGAVSG
jgi:hypothetical protein